MAMPVFRIGLKSWCVLSPAEAHPDEGKLPASLRRRLTPLGRRALAAALSLQPGAGTRFVFSSRHGEYSRTYSMLRSLAEQDAVSPADFSLSVHHALAGLLSIVTGSRKGHTALAAAGDTLGYALLEASLCLAEAPGEPVLLLHCDEPLPGVYADLQLRDGPGAVIALLLGPPGGRGDIEVTMASLTDGTSGQQGDLTSAFAAFLTSSDPEGSTAGDRFTWVWRRA